MHTALGSWLLMSLQQGNRHLPGEGDVEAARDEAQHRGRAVGHDGELDAVEIGPALPPVVGVPRDLDALVLLEFDELEGAGADRLGAHLRRRHVAGIDRREAGGEQRQDRGLRPLEMDRDLVVAVGGDALDVAVPRLARVAAQLLLALAGQQVEGADDVLGREGLAVVPLHAALQLEGEILVVGAPAPRLGEVGDDGLRAVLRLALVVEHQVVEQRHEGDDRGVGRLLVDRGAGRIVAMIHFQHAAALLGERNAIRTHQGSREAAQQDDRTHGRSLPWRAACRAAASRPL